jgi:hypothetical protein
MAEVKKARLFLRRGTDTDRKLTTLCEGELGYSTDAFRVIIGDGDTDGGRSLGSTVHVSGGTLGPDFHTNLTEASAFPGQGGYALSGDLAIFSGADYQGGTVSTIKPEHATTVMILTGSNPATASHWVNVNNNIPFGNISVSANDITGDYVSGGVITAPITLSGGLVHIGGVGPSENLVLSGTYLSAATLPTDDLIFPVGLTSAAQLTCIDSIYGFGVQTDSSSSNIGNNVGYLAATSTAAASAVSAYAYTSSAYTINGSSSYGNNASATATSNSTYGDTTGMDIFTSAGYLGSGGAYADGTGTMPLPLPFTHTGISSKCKIAELVYNITQIKNATAKNASGLSWTDIVEFYFSVYYKHYDDAAAFIGHHNHLLNSNQIAHWNGSSIKHGKMRAVPEVEHIAIPNTYDASDAATQILVIHLGFAATGNIGIQLTGVRLRN